MTIFTTIIIFIAVGAIIGFLFLGDGENGKGAAVGAYGAFVLLLSIARWLLPIILGILVLNWLFD